MSDLKRLEALAWNAYLFDPDATLLISDTTGGVIAVRAQDVITLLDRAARWADERAEVAGPAEDTA